MFGSKLRSWMETHIVRPRKKGSKHKQAASEAGSSCSNHSKKAGTLPPQGSNLTSPVLTSSGSHSIASPVRRREVSPIQCHPPSRRYGWQSPDEDSYVITSPKSDNLLYAPHCYQPQPQAPHHLSVPNSKDNSCTEKSPIRVNCSSSSISSLSWSTGSKEPSSGKQATLREQFFNGEYHIPKEEEVEYEEVGALLLRPPAPIPADQQRPQSENLSSVRLIYEEEPRQSNNHVRYGRLLPSKLAQLGESLDNLKPPIPPAPLAGSRMRTPRGMQRSNIMPGPRPHSLPSPESAYSTGYSTDGTSPCAASNYNPPEYYINMRSGTHYFPKSVNSLAIEAQRYKFGLNRIEEMSPMDPLPKSNFTSSNHGLESSPSPLAVRQQPKIFESPSPRQRCRIRTNPWYNTGEHLPASSGPTRIELDATSTTSTTSSGIKSSNELEVPAAKTTANKAGKAATYTPTPNCRGTPSKTTRVAGVDTFGGGTVGAPGAGVAYESEGSSSSTEVENLHAAHTIKRRHLEQAETTTTSAPVAAGGGAGATTTSFVLSDDEATLNEMIGKFDESYIYEKETDILSDSDFTDCCASELDTGRDAGDECDTDELLDIDFIDTSSMQEMVLDRQDLSRNLGSCHYYSNQPISPVIKRKASTRSRRKSGQETGENSQQHRRKRFLKTRKKSSENRENREKLSSSPFCEPRGSRSVGGTPVCLRRNLLGPRERIYKTSPLSNRSNSLIFGSINEKNTLTIAESEKALFKADLEADIKYKQLIMEAESLLESLKNSLQSIPRDTPVASPRRLNPLANKRVEMLKNSEVDSKKQASLQNSVPLEHDLAAAINKRIEMLKFETSSTASPPNSPKLGRCSPRKTHLTNFMNQNAPPELPPRKINGNTPTAPLSPQLQLNGRRLQESPKGKRRTMMVTSTSTTTTTVISFNGSDSEMECIAVEDISNHNYLPPNIKPEAPIHSKQVPEPQINNNFYCPHSEPLKRKVYRGSSSFERIKKNFDLELDANGRSKSSERSQIKLSAPVSAKSSMQDVTVDEAKGQAMEGSNCKQQLILNTIVDLKRSLEHQSHQLTGLNVE
ncbi:uncharacterized protein LOC108046224 isoform X2 [Drosophila rhopaloa]|uniref:Uncharacterized protein LOC108046224 isoform X2 n=1 Tax=Drosophila rhopaloa TaxID=1041015 RepID=A0A6P4F7F7_DRORH|nr:uncharacterized protein LOC108046224 isoform X2 [Drosophila rhopaloa]